MPAAAETPSFAANATNVTGRFCDSTLQKRAVTLLIFLFCFAYLCIFRHYSTLEPDEGIVLEGAERILRGEVPYRDFFSFYTPGSFYLVALIFRIFGDSLAIARLSVAAAGALCSVVTYLLARRVCSRGMSLFAAVLTTVAGAAFRFLVLHNVYSTVICCLAVYSAVRVLEKRQAGWSFATGSFTALTFLFEQSKGAGLFAGLLLGLVVLSKFHKSHWPAKLVLVPLTLGMSWPVVTVFSYFGLQGAAKVMLEDWLWPLQHYTRANHVPYGFQNWSDQARNSLFHSGPAWIRAVQILAASPGLIVPVLPLVAVGLLIYWIMPSRRGAENPDASYYILLCSAMAGLLASVVVVRADVLHFMYLAPLWYVVLAWALASRDSRSRMLLAVRPYLKLYTVFAFGLLSCALLFTATGAHYVTQTRRGLITTGKNDTIIDYVQAHVANADDLLVYPYLPLYNYLSGTHSPSRYDYFQPGMNTPHQAQEIISSLEQHRATPVLYEPWFSEKFANSWPGTPLASVASDPVADYILRHYQLCKMLTSSSGWRFHYMVRKERQCPK
jgi:4-amino-4-deoxy-L-arabinose transferase-like glycosyltransferase